VRGLAIVVLFLLVGCRLDVFGQGSAEDSSSSGDAATSTGNPATSTGDATTAVASGTGTTASVGSSSSSSSSEGSSSTTGPVLACGDMLPAPGGGCDEICTDCDAEGVCLFDCTGPDACIDDIYFCPEGRPCLVECSGPSACRNVQIACPPDHECNVECTGADACFGVVIVCDSGPCTLTCNTNARSCTMTELQCSSSNEGTIACNTEQEDPKPDAVPHPEGTCECEVSEDC
jgi:hypothetical protein